MQNLYLVPVKSKVEISQNFEALSEYMNFNMVGIICLLEIGLFNHQNRGECRLPSPPPSCSDIPGFTSVQWRSPYLAWPHHQSGRSSDAGINAKNLKRPCANGIEKSRGREHSSAFFPICYS